MAAIVYMLCALTSLACAVLLMRGYINGRVRLLFWSGLCFAGLAVNNILLFIDLVVVVDIPNVDLSAYRLGSALFAMIVLVYGLIWDLE